MDSKIGLIIQLNGVILITVLTFFMRRSLRTAALKYWAIAWLCLSFALVSLRLGFSFGEFGPVLFAYYFLGEYLFGFMLVVGCRSLHDESELSLRSELVILLLIAVAIALSLFTEDFNDVYNIHSLIMSGMFAAAYYQIGLSPMRSFGWRVMHVALLLLALEFFGYFVIFTARQSYSFSTAFMTYGSVVDLVLETMLSFGMVITLLERVLADSKRANEELYEAHRQLEVLAQTDPLTAAFNRHAFYGFVKKNGEENSVTSGCVGFFDIDGLKSINDRFGHAAGDAAIRHVVRAIRCIIRAEDLIYRWGGDEFFVIMVSMDAEMAEDRMARLAGLLHGVEVEGSAEPIDIGVAWGFTDFHDTAELESAIKAADAAMYRRKQERKGGIGDPRYIGCLTDAVLKA